MSDHPAAPDPVGRALASIAAGACGGAATVTVGLLLFRWGLTQALPLILLAGLVVAATTAWALAAGIDDTWRRGVTAALGAFGAMMLAALTAPADIVAGPVGLALYAVLLSTACGYGIRFARR